MSQQFNIVQTSFAAGEVTEAMQSREDLAKQHVAAKTIRNGIVTSIGSVVNRGGLSFVAEVNDSSVQHRLIPFTYSREQSYALVWGDNLSIVKNGVLTLHDIVDAAVYKWTLSGSGTSEYYLELLAGGDPGLVEPKRLLENNLDMTIGTVGSLTAGQWDWGDNDALGYNTVYARILDSTDPDTKSDGYLQMVLLFSTPYNAGQVANLDNAQSADVMYLTNPVFYPYKLIRTSDTNWSLVIAPYKDGPWKGYKDGDDEVTMTPSARSGAGVTITASDTYPMDTNWGGINDQLRLGYENPFDISEIDWFWATITGSGTPTTRVVTIEDGKSLGWEFLLNPDFRDGIGFWESRSTLTSTLSHDAANQLLVFNKAATGEAIAVQEVTVEKYTKMQLEVVVDTVNTNIRVQMGTTPTGVDVLAAKNITTPGTYVYDTLDNAPSASTVYVYIWTTGAPVSSTHKIARVSLKRKDLATNKWRISALNSDQGFPNTITKLEDRFFLGGNNLEQPDTIWSTRIGEYEYFGFNSPLLDTDAVTVTLGSGEVNDITFLKAHGELIAGTSQEEWKIAPDQTSNTLTPTSTTVKVISSQGSASIKPLIAGDSLLFLNRNANKVFALKYSLDAGTSKPIDLTILAPHLFNGYTITEWAYQKSPYSIIWMVRSDGKLIGLTYIEDQEISAFHLHDTNGFFESVCVVPEVGSDTVYFVVKRTIGGNTKRYIEKLEPRLTDEAIYDWYQVDSGVTINNPLTISGITQADPGVVTITGHTFNNGDIVRLSKVVGMTEVNGVAYKVANKTANDFELTDRYTGANIDTTGFTAYVSGGQARLMVTTVTGLDHLEGETVTGIADGSLIPDTVVSSGQITIDAASLIHVGLPITFQLKTMPHDFISGDGSSTSQGKLKSVSLANVYFNKSRYAYIGADEDNTTFMKELQPSSGNPPALQTGIFEQGFASGYSKLVHTFIENDKPIPIEIMGTITTVEME